MRSRCLFILPLALLLFIAGGSAVTAQDKTSGIRSIAAKSKVFVDGESEARAAVEQVLRSDTKLQIVADISSAEFVVSVKRDVQFKSDVPLTLANDMPRLPEANERRPIEDIEKSRTRGTVVIKFDVTYRGADGKSVRVWSRTASSKFYDGPATGKVTRNGREDLRVQEPERYFDTTPKYAELANRFLRDLNKARQ